MEILNKFYSKVEGFVTRKALRYINGQEVLALQIDITSNCNLRCTHCYLGEPCASQTMSFEQAVFVIDEYSKLLNKLKMVPCIVIGGGEPLIYQDLVQRLIVYIKEKFVNVEISIITNGTINLKDIQFYTDHEISFQVSLDGATAKSHDSVRGEGNFVKACEFIVALTQSNISVTSLTVLTSDTSKEIEKQFRLGRKLGLDSVNFTRLISSGNGKRLKSSKLSPVELRTAYMDIVSLSKKVEVLTSTNSPLFCLIDEGLGCSGMFGHQGVVISSDGSLKVSSRADYVVGNIFVTSLLDLFLNDKVYKDLRGHRKSECRDCRYFRKCGGDRNAAFAETGSFMSKDPDCWIDL